MTAINKTANRLINETSPYLLQHARNPVDWYPWCEEAFAKAANENKPVFLSVGYSTCHWCHVMERESFEADSIAEILNQYFVPIKVDKEERPDIDGVYMQVCMAMTGSGGWPLTILMTPDKKPFYAGTYLPKRSRRHMTGLTELLETVRQKWQADDSALLERADEITKAVQVYTEMDGIGEANTDMLIKKAYRDFSARFDSAYGGFGTAPKFPSPHNLMFLIEYDRVFSSTHALYMAEKTLTQMYRGGIFDHIGYGFSRYSTDEQWLAPHFEKMLYDNAMLVMAYTRMYTATGNTLYKDVAKKAIQYVLRELGHPEGGFYSAQDADIEGEEGKFYLLEPQEVIDCLGPEDGAVFNETYDITESGNFEGKNIPNLLKSEKVTDDKLISKLQKYRQSRYKLHKDDKVLASWNGLMIAALAQAYMAFSPCDEHIIDSAKRAVLFAENSLMSGTEVFTSFREGRRSAQGFLDDYACMCFAMIEMHRATCDEQYLHKASALCKKAAGLFFDVQEGGFRTSGTQNETLILDLKETYDGAAPSGNSIMAYNMVMLSLFDAWESEDTLQKHLGFMSKSAGRNPAGQSFFLTALLLHNSPPKNIISCGVRAAH